MTDYRFVPRSVGTRSWRNGIMGFTLIELMIVVAVVAILAAIAYPSYQDAVRKSRRAQAKADLVELAALAERFRTVENKYTGFTLPFTQSPREAGATARYTLTATAAANTLTLTAAPTPGQDADKCGTLTINEAGAKTESGSAALSECW